MRGQCPPALLACAALLPADRPSADSPRGREVVARNRFGLRAPARRQPRRRGRRLGFRVLESNHIDTPAGGLREFCAELDDPVQTSSPGEADVCATIAADRERDGRLADERQPATGAQSSLVLLKGGTSRAGSATGRADDRMLASVVSSSASATSAGASTMGSGTRLAANADGATSGAGGSSRGSADACMPARSRTWVRKVEGQPTIGPERGPRRPL